METSLERSIRVLKFCIAEHTNKDSRVASVIEGILIANNLLDTVLKFQYNDVTESQFSIFARNRTKVRKETYREMMLRLAKEAIPILELKLDKF